MILKLLFLFFLILLVTVILALFQHKIKLNYEKIVLPQLAPGIVFLVAFLFFSSLRTSINIELNPTVALRGLFSLLIPIVLFSIGFFVCKTLGVDVTVSPNTISIVPLMFVGLLVGAIGEEIGWRGFMQPNLEKEFSIIWASVIVGVFWGFWHIGHYKNGVVFIIGFLFFSISASIIIGQLLKGTNYNLIISVLFHFSINLGFLLFFKSSLSNSKMMLVNGVVWLIPAILLILVSARDIVFT
jgi:uncharacterized protein